MPVGVADRSVEPMTPTPAVSRRSRSHWWRSLLRRRPTGARARGGLVRKYTIVLAALVGGTAVAISLVGLWFTYGDTQAATSRLERAAAVLAATRLGPVVFGAIEGRVRSLAGANGELPFSEATRLRRWRSILPRLGVDWGWDRLRYVDPSGRERLRMVRGTVIHERGRLDLARDPLVRAARFQVLAYSAPHLGRGQIAGGTYVTIAAANPQGGVTLIDANTGFFREQLNLFLGGPQLRDFHLVRYLVDDRGRLVARQDPDLQRVRPGPTEPVDTRELPQVKRALASHAENPEPIGRVDGRGLDGQSVISAFAPVDPPGWFVIVDEPRSEALGPVYSAALRYGLMVLCALGIAVLAGVLLARRMVRPIGALRDGAVKLGAGELDDPIAVHTGDELEDLAQEFNRMAEELRRPTPCSSSAWTSALAISRRRSPTMHASCESSRRPAPRSPPSSRTCPMSSGRRSTRSSASRRCSIDRRRERSASVRRPTSRTSSAPDATFSR